VSDATPGWRRLYEGWLAIAGRFGHVQTQVILAIFYALMIGPISLGTVLSRGDLLAKRGLGSRDSAWCETESAAPELERARRQF